MRFPNVKEMTISQRLMLYFSCLSLCVTTLSGTIYYAYMAELSQSLVAKEMRHGLGVIKDRFNVQFALQIQGDLQYLTSSAYLDTFLRVAQEDIPLARPAVENDFLRLSRTNPDYLRVSFYDPNGQELVSIQRDKRIRQELNLFTLEGNDPLYRHTRILFERLKKLSGDGIAAEGPFQDPSGRQTILIGIPKKDPDTLHFGGAILAHLDMTHFIRYASEFRILDLHPVSLADMHGNKLVSSAIVNESTWLNLLLMADEGDYPDQLEDTISLGVDQAPILRISVQSSNAIFASQLKGALGLTLLTSLGILLISTLITLWIARQLTRPLIDLVNVSVQIGEGKLDARVHTHAGGELGLLSRSFNRMVDALHNMTVSRDYVDNIIGSMKDMLMVLTVDHKIERVNRATCNVLGYEPEELIGQPMDKLLGQHPMAELLAKRQLLGHPQNPILETTLVAHDGTQIPVTLSLSELSSSPALSCGLVCVAHDQTEHQRAQWADALARSNAELERFAFVASHDLQEPLRKVITFSDRLRGKYSAALGPDGIAYIERMQNASRRMQTLISSLLTYARVTSTARPFASVNLNQIISEVLSDLETRIDPDQDRIEVDVLPEVDADELQMRQLFQNLIGNALKFRKKDQPICIKIRCQDQHPAGATGQALAAPQISPGTGLENCPRQAAAEENRTRISGAFGSPPRPSVRGFCQLSVEDDGIGFDEKYVDRIFGIFQRLNGRDEYEGTGVGLAICRKIVERHGGEITAHGQDGEGAQFIFSLPIHSHQEAIAA